MVHAADILLQFLPLKDLPDKVVPQARKSALNLFSKPNAHVRRRGFESFFWGKKAPRLIMDYGMFH
jgi:hypothetical protein